MKKTVAILTFLSLMACAKEGLPVGVDQPGREDFGVTFLFEKDGVRIYRFSDAGEYRYFSVGRGSFQPQEQTRSNGKTSVHWWDGAENTEEGK